MVEYDSDFEQMTIVCDECGDEDVYTGTESNCMAQARKVGWRIRKDGADFINVCKPCEKELYA